MNDKELQSRIDLADGERKIGNFESALTLITDVLFELENPHQPPYYKRDTNIFKVQLAAYFSHDLLLANRGDFYAALKIREYTLAFCDKYSHPRSTSTRNLLGAAHRQPENYGNSLEYFTKILSEDRAVGKNIKGIMKTYFLSGITS